MIIHVKEILVETHNSVNKIERYHISLKRVYQIIQEEIDAKSKIILQIVVKAINNSVELNELMSTLLIFDVYSRMTDDSFSSSSIAQRAEIIRKAMKEIQHLHAKRQMQDALVMRNESNVESIINLLIQSDIRI